MKKGETNMEVLDPSWSDDFLQSILNGDPICDTENVDLDVFSLPIPNFDEHMPDEIQLEGGCTDMGLNLIKMESDEIDLAPSSSASDSGLSSEDSEQVQLQEIVLDGATTDFIWEEECSTSSGSPTPQDLNLTTTNRPYAIRLLKVPVSSIHELTPQSQLQKKIVTSSVLRRPSPCSSPLDDVQIIAGEDGVLELSEEEVRLFAKEGMKPPSHFPLTRIEERDLKRIRRKIRNKISAQDSRRRKREYMEGLEQRVRSSETESAQLRKRLRLLESKNSSLSSQLHRLQQLLTNSATGTGAGTNKTTQKATCMLVLLLSLALFFGPNSLKPPMETDGEVPSPLDGMAMSSKVVRGPSRTLLHHTEGSTSNKLPINTPAVAMPQQQRKSSFMLDDHDYFMQHCNSPPPPITMKVGGASEPMDCSYWSPPERSFNQYGPAKSKLGNNRTVGNMIVPPLDE